MVVSLLFVYTYLYILYKRSSYDCKPGAKYWSVLDFMITVVGGV